MKGLFLIFGFVAFNVFAVAEVDNATVVNVRVDESGFGYVRFDKALGGSPASCISGHDFHLSFDLNTAGGNGIMSLVLSAQSTGKKIKARGTGQCNSYSGVEGWSWGYVTR